MWTNIIAGTSLAVVTGIFIVWFFCTFFKKAIHNDKIKPILPNDPDYKIAKNAYDNYKKHPEDYVGFDDIKWD